MTPSAPAFYLTLSFPAYIIKIYTIKGDEIKVQVGEILHPMTEEHYIEWISLQTTAGNQRKFLHPGDKPEVTFALCDGEEIEAVFAYCNLHSLWKSN